jgi:hypothetical protein
VSESVRFNDYGTALWGWGACKGWEIRFALRAQRHKEIATRCSRSRCVTFLHEPGIRFLPHSRGHYVLVNAGPAEAEATLY